MLMRQDHVCPNCGHKMLADIRLSSLLCDLFDRLEGAGGAGMTRDDLIASFFADRPDGRTSLTSAIAHLNALLAGTHLAVRSKRMPGVTTYRLHRYRNGRRRAC